jgi:nanoRNase/pAp phosphatase (c-di-AMP/oligoRNAs hydrolase)
MNNPERIARLKAAQRIRLERVEGWLVAFSEIGSYHASAARALLNLGAHIAAVGRLKNDEIALTFRSSREFFETTGFHLATDLAMPLGEEMGGTGGGHPTAAAVRVKGDWSETVNRCIHLLRAGLKSNH